MKYIYIATLVLVIILYGGCSSSNGNTYITITTDEYWQQYRTGAVDSCMSESIAQLVQRGILLSSEALRDMKGYCIVKSSELMDRRFFPNLRMVPMPTPMIFDPAGPT